MDTILPTNETSEFEGRLYLNPQIQLDESSNFIDNLRATQTQQNQEIAQQTHNLGTDIPSNLGGLTGANSYFTSRYQTPQTNAIVSDLRATAQAQALNQVLQNQQDMWRKRYNDAYRSYQKRSGGGGSGGGSGSGGGGGGDDGNSSTWDGETLLNPTDGNDGNDGNGGNENSRTDTPPNPDDYYVTGEEQTQKIQERIKEKTNIDVPDWMINVLKIVG